MESKGSSTEEHNAELIYRYIEHSLQATSTSLSGLGTRLTTLIGFSGLLLRFTIDLPQKVFVMNWNVAIGVKILVSSALALAIVVSAFGLLPQPTGEAYTAEELLDELDGHDEIFSKLYITLSRDKTLQSLDKLRFYRAKCLKWATFLVMFAALLFAIDISLFTVIQG